MTKDTTMAIEKIKSEGYWQIHIYPLDVNRKAFQSLVEIKDIMRANNISLRGWSYPYIPELIRDDNSAIYNKGDSVEAWVDWQSHKEFWKMQLSGNFLHILGMGEDWFKEDSWIPEDSPLREIKARSVLGVERAIFTITEINLFVKNLVDKGIYNAVAVEVCLDNSIDRELHIFRQMSIPLMASYKAMLNKIELPRLEFSSKDELEKYLNAAIENITYLFSQFNWDRVSDQVIKSNQQKLLNREI